MTSSIERFSGYDGSTTRDGIVVTVGDDGLSVTLRVLEQWECDGGARGRRILKRYPIGFNSVTVKRSDGDNNNKGETGVWKFKVSILTQWDCDREVVLEAGSFNQIHDRMKEKGLSLNEIGRLVRIIRLLFTVLSCVENEHAAENVILFQIVEELPSPTNASVQARL